MSTEWVLALVAVGSFALNVYMVYWSSRSAERQIMLRSTVESRIGKLIESHNALAELLSAVETAADIQRAPAEVRDEWYSKVPLKANEFHTTLRQVEPLMPKDISDRTRAIWDRIKDRLYRFQDEWVDDRGEDGPAKLNKDLQRIRDEYQALIREICNL